MEALAVIPDLQSAIRVDGGEGGCVRIMLDLYLKDPTQLSELLALRGKELVIALRATN